MRRLLLLTCSAALVASACSFADNVAPNPVPVSTTTTTTTSASGGGGAGPQDAGAVKRTVSTRSPFGGPAGNLLVDGDFEFSIVLEGHGSQAGWNAFGGNGQRYLRGETGGLCRTGLRCGVLVPGTMLYGRGTSANGTGMLASIWSKPPADQPCSVVQPYLVHCNFSGVATNLLPTSELPGADGWCGYHTSLKEQDTATCMIVENTLASSETALVDSAQIIPDDGTVSQRAMAPVGGERYLRFKRIGKWARDRLPFGRPLPKPDIGPR